MHGLANVRPLIFTFTNEYRNKLALHSDSGLHYTLMTLIIVQ